MSILCLGFACEQKGAEGMSNLRKNMEMKKDDEKPPGSENNMDTGAGHIPAHDSLAGRFKSIGELWRGCWSVPPVRNSLHGRCHFISKNIRGGG